MYGWLISLGLAAILATAAVLPFDVFDVPLLLLPHPLARNIPNESLAVHIDL
jgi:hypothetical protein